MGASVRGRLLGRFEVSVDGRRIGPEAFERPSGLRLLKLLLATPGHRVRREAAAELLWPEADPERSAANLRKAIHFARRALEGHGQGATTVIRSDGEWLRFDDGVLLDLDLDRLRDALEAASSGETGPAFDAGSAIEALAELAGADLLPEDPYEEWVTALRERLRNQAREHLLDGAALARSHGRRELAFRLLDRALTLDPADEDAHRIAIELHLDAGHLHSARRQLQACSRAVAEAFGVEPSPELAALVDRAAAARQVAGTAPPGELPIIGRRHELEAADDAFDAIAGGRGGVVVYRGSAGIGKSRVLRELVRSASASGWRVAEVHGLEASPGLAFAAFGAGLATALADRLPGHLGEPGRSALVTIAPRLGEQPAIAFASEGALLTGLLDALDQLARSGPLVLAFDDLQWLDLPTIDLVAAAATRLQNAAVLIAATVRDGPDRPPPQVRAWLGRLEREGGRVVHLGPIPQREIHRILERDAVGLRVDERLAAAVAERAGGAPLFASEVLRSAREAGLVVERAGSLYLDVPAAELPVPATVQLTVARRTDRLPASTAGALRIAAEIGDEYTLEALEAAVTDDRSGRSAAIPAQDGEAAWTVLDALDAGIAAGLVVERRGGYAFAHPLFRAALRESVRPGDRAEIHLRVARVLGEGVEPDDAASVGTALRAGRDVVGAALHALAAAELGRAEAIGPAIGFGFAAGGRQAAVFDHLAAIDTLERSLALWKRLAPERRHTYPAARALVQLGWSRHATGDEPAASAAFLAAVAAARDDVEQVEAWQAAAWMPYQHGHFESAERLLADALDRLVDAGARGAIEVDRAWIVYRRGDWRRAHEMLTRVGPAIEATAAPSLIARYLDRLGVAMVDVGEHAGAVIVLERALRTAQEAGDARIEAVIRMHLARALRRVGALDAASSQIEAGLRLCAATGDRYIEAVTTWMAAEVEHARGRYAEAIACRRRELDILATIGGNEQHHAMAYAHLAHLGRLAGDAALAEEAAAAAQTAARHSRLDHLPALVARTLADEDWFDRERSAQDQGQPAIDPVGNVMGTPPPDPAGRDL